MEGWEVEEAFADHYNREWEKMNNPETTMELQIEQAIDEMNADPYADIEYDEINEAWAYLETGDYDFTMLIKQVDGALDAIRDTPDGDRLVSVRDDLEKLRKAMAEIKDSVHEASQRAYPMKRAAEQMDLEKRRAGA